MTLRVAITGASGFLGRALVKRLLKAGAEVHALSRAAITLPGVNWHAYDLSATPPAVVAHCNVIVHAAFAMGTNRDHDKLELLNRNASAQLLAIARKNHRHLVFISSMSAHGEAVSSYGRTKWLIERDLDPSQDSIVRPGLIIGPGGVYARMLASLRQTPVVPIFFGGGQPIHPIGVADLVEGLARIVERQLAGDFNLGSVSPITVRELYQNMLAAIGVRRHLVPLSGNLALSVLRWTEALRVPLPLTTENLLGQKHLRAFETAASLTQLGLPLMPLSHLNWTTTSSAQ
jgi:nucleoside-diphosphate-sugar epimerase